MNLDGIHRNWRIKGNTGCGNNPFGLFDKPVLHSQAKSILQHHFRVLYHFGTDWENSPIEHHLAVCYLRSGYGDDVLFRTIVAEYPRAVTAQSWGYYGTGLDFLGYNIGRLCNCMSNIRRGFVGVEKAAVPLEVFRGLFHRKGDSVHSFHRA